MTILFNLLALMPAAASLFLPIKTLLGLLAAALGFEFALLLLFAHLTSSVRQADRLMWLMLAASTVAVAIKLWLWPTPTFPAELGIAAALIALTVHAALVVILHALALRLMKAK